MVVYDILCLVVSYASDDTNLVLRETMPRTFRSVRVAVTPVWAQQIQVERHQDALLVTGWGHLPLHIDGRMVDPTQLPSLDLLAKFRHYMLNNLNQRREEAQDVGFYQFTEATDDEKLISFVESFGPFWGQVIEREGAGLFMAQKITVRQDFADLRKEQARFAAAVGLLRELNRSEPPPDMVTTWREMIGAMMKIYPVPSAYMPRKGVPAAIKKLAVPTQPGTMMSDDQPWLWTYLTLSELASGQSEGRAERIMECAHRTLCNLLNEQPLILIPANGSMPVEMPRLLPQGIAGALYYKLRLDYLAGRELRTCLNCGNHFPVERRGMRWCSKECGRAAKNLKYWNQHGKEINRKRRQGNNENPSQP